MPAADGEFIFGSVSDPKAKFAINGLPVSVHPNGAFLSWQPIKPGTFTFLCELFLKKSTAAYQRGISVIGPSPALPEKPLAIDADSLWPKSDLELRAGDWLVARMRASPGQAARFKLPKHRWLPLRETAAFSGIYEGTYQAGGSDELASEGVDYRLGSGWSEKAAQSRGKVTINAGTPAVAAVKSPQLTAVKTAPGAGYLLFSSSGTKFVTAGRTNSEVKVRLSDAQSGWIDAKDLEYLPAGTPPPRAEMGTIHTSASKEATTVRIALSERVPYAVEEGEDLNSLTVRFFYTFNHTNWIVYDSSDTFVREIRWKQEAADVAAVTIRLNPEMTLWGYQAQFDGGSIKIELRRAPRLATAGSPLSGRTVFLDPGHMPSASGATGPMGTKEMDANFAIAKAVAFRLSEEGAIPVLSRDTTWQEVSLPDRPKLALEKKADIFVSLHNNALPEGENPFARPRGFGVFYYHPHSMAMASDVYRSYEKRVPLPGEELRYGNLHVARLTAMPAILIENAYIIIPAQEEKLNDPEFRDTLAKAVVAGLRTFLEREREKQLTKRKGARP